MSYSDFTLEMVIRELGLAVRGERLFPVEPVREASAWFREALGAGATMAWASEKARSEFIVAPLLLDCKRAVGENLHIHSGIRLDVDEVRGLRGECDFILAATPPKPVLEAPLVIVLEAKKHDIEEGLGQCGAQVFAARLFNHQHGRELSPLYGCVTNGDIWQFLKLQASDLLIDTKRYYINEVDKILGILTTIAQLPQPPLRSTSAA